MLHKIKSLICRIVGHKWEIYAYMPKSGYYSYDLEQAGHCERCGYDTHETEGEH